MLKDAPVPTHRHSASDITRGTLSPARLPSTVASQADMDDLSVLVADLETDKADVDHTHDDRYYTETEVDALLAPLVEDTGWTTLTLETGLESKSGTPRVRRVGGVVHLGGVVGPISGAFSAATSAILFTLPEGFRPSQSEWFTGGSTTNQAVGTIVVSATGLVTLRPPGTSLSYVGLGGISFLTD